MARKGSQLSWRDLFGFDRFIFPKVATFIWILSVIVWALYTLFALSEGALNFISFLTSLLFLVGIRLYIELMLVWFKIYEKV